VQKLQEKLTSGGGQLGPLVNKAIASIIDSLSGVAQTEDGRQRLYESIRYTDDSVIDYPEEHFAGKTVSEVFSAGNALLGGLVGNDARDSLALSLTQDGIDQQQADSVVGFLTPAVLGSLKREIDRGRVLDNPDGIGQLFFGNGVAAPVSASAELKSDSSASESRGSSLKIARGKTESGSAEEVVDSSDSPNAGSSSVGSHPENHVRQEAASRQALEADGPVPLSSGGGAVTNAHEDDTGDWSWLFRYALPALLMGGLMLAGVKNCGGYRTQLIGDVAPSASELEALASVESLRAELSASQESAQQQDSLSQSRISELETQIDDANAEKTSALNQLQEVSNALEQTQTEQQDAAELTALVNSITSERNSATNQLGLLQNQLEQSSTDKTVAINEVAELKQQLASLQSVDVVELQRELDSVRAESNANREAFTRLNVDLDAAKVALAEAEELKVQFDTVNAEKAQTENEVRFVHGELEKAKNDVDAARAEAETARAEANAVKTELEAAQLEITAANTARIESADDYELRLESSEITQLAFQDEIDRLKTVLENTVATSNADAAAAKGAGEVEAQQLRASAAQDREALTQEMDLLKGTNSELEQRLDQSIVELALASDTSEDIQAQLISAQERVVELELESENVLALNVGLDAQVVDLESKLDTVRQSSSSDISRLTDVSTDLQNQLEVTVDARDEAQASIAQRDIQIDELNSTVSSLQASLDTATADSSSLQETVEALTESNATMAAEVEQSASVIDSNNVKIGDLELELQQKADELISLSAERDDLLNQKAQLDESVSALSAERDEVTASSTQLNEQLSDLSARLKQANTQSEEGQSRVSSLTSSLTDVQSELALVTSDRDKFAKQTELLAAETVRYQSEIVELREESDQSASQLARLTGEFATLKNDADTAVAELAVAQDSEAESTRKATLLENNVDGLNKEIERLKNEHVAELAELSESVSALRAESETATTASAQTAVQAEALKRENVEMKGVIGDLQGSYDSAQSDVVSLTNRVSELETEVEAITTARDSATLEAEDVRTKLANSELRVVEISGLADGYRSQLEQADEARRSEIQSINAVKDGIAASLSEESVDNVEVTTRDANTAVGITIDSGNLFRPGSADLSPEGREILARVGGIVANLSDWKIDVEGHTDNQPIGGTLVEQYPTNWELSAARASSALRFLEVESGIDPTLLSARGFGETRPLDADDTPDARRKNRRVELVLRK